MTPDLETKDPKPETQDPKFWALKPKNLRWNPRIQNLNLEPRISKS